MPKLDVITFGEAMAMFIAKTTGPLHEVSEYTRELAGAETNVAIGLSRLGFKSAWVSKVGNDSFGKFIINKLKNENVNIEEVHVDTEHPTGFQLKGKVLEGDPEVQYYRKGSAASHLDVSDFNEAYFENARHLHMTGIPLALSMKTRAFAEYALTFMKNKKRTVTFDPNLRPTLWKTKTEMISVTNTIASLANIVLPGIQEGEILTGYKDPYDIAAFYLDKGVDIVIVKLGKYGAFYKTAKEEGSVPGFTVSKVVDTVGAGDGFAVGFISGLLEHLSLYDSVLRGNAIGALAVQSPGDNDGYPTKPVLIDYIDKHLKGSEVK